MRKLLSAFIFLISIASWGKTVGDFELSRDRSTVMVDIYSDNLSECEIRVQSWREGYEQMGRFVLASACALLPEDRYKEMKERDPQMWWTIEATMRVNN